ncbi:hypothetical protein HAX54_029513, partial [Datura stramonium]|nr:hypothetical protein [Datura stramonium]
RMARPVNRRKTSEKFNLQSIFHVTINGPSCRGKTLPFNCEINLESLPGLEQKMMDKLTVHRLKEKLLTRPPKSSNFPPNILMIQLKDFSLKP